MYHQEKHSKHSDIFHGRTFVGFPLDLGASTGAGLLKGEGISISDSPRQRTQPQETL